jgi:hypothetical protein
VRQLNFYGFKKVKVDRIKIDNIDADIERKCWRFKHDNFRRGRPELLEEIKKGDHNAETGAVDIQEVDEMMREVTSLRSQIAALSADAKSLASFILQTQQLGTAAAAPNTGSPSGTKRESSGIIDQNIDGWLSHIEKKHRIYHGPYNDCLPTRPSTNHSHNNEGTTLPPAPKYRNPDAPPTNISNYNDSVRQSTSYTKSKSDAGEMLVPDHKIVLSPQACARFLQSPATSSINIQEHGSHNNQQGGHAHQEAQRRWYMESCTSFGSSVPGCFKDSANQLDADDFEPSHLVFPHPQGQAHTDDHTKGQGTSYGSLVGAVPLLRKEDHSQNKINTAREKHREYPIPPAEITTISTPLSQLTDALSTLPEHLQTVVVDRLLDAVAESADEWDRRSGCFTSAKSIGKNRAFKPVSKNAFQGHTASIDTQGQTKDADQVTSSATPSVGSCVTFLYDRAIR